MNIPNVNRVGYLLFTCDDSSLMQIQLEFSNFYKRVKKISSMTKKNEKVVLLNVNLSGLEHSYLGTLCERNK